MVATFALGFLTGTFDVLFVVWFFYLLDIPMKVRIYLFHSSLIILRKKLKCHCIKQALLGCDYIQNVYQKAGNLSR